MDDRIEILMRQEAEAKWKSRPRFPRCPATVNGIEPITLDANIAGLLTRHFQSKGDSDALVIYELTQLRDKLDAFLSGAHGECLEYFESLDEVLGIILKSQT